MDHRTEPPSWLSGAAAVGTGADPPDAETDGDKDGGQSHQAGNDNAEAPEYSGPGYGSPGSPMFGDGQGDAPDFGEITTGAHDFSGVSGYADNGTPDFNGPPDGGAGFGSAHGYADAPAQAPDFSGPPPGDYAGPSGPGPGYAGDRLADPFDAPRPGGSFDGPGGGFGPPPQADAAQGFGDDQLVDYGAGQFHQSGGGFGTPPPGDPFGGSAFGGPPGYQPGQENGIAATQAQAPPFAPQYPPVEPPGRRPSPSGRMTASLRTVKRPKSGRKRKNAPGRQAQLTVARFEPWSVMKFSFVISLVAFIVFFVAIAVLYAILSGLGVFSALQHTVSNITSSQSSGGFNLMTYLSASRVLGYTGLLGAINVVLITALSTVGSVLYNITADLAGGVEITLKETD